MFYMKNHFNIFVCIFIKIFLYNISKDVTRTIPCSRNRHNNFSINNTYSKITIHYRVVRRYGIYTCTHTHIYKQTRLLTK